MPYVPATCPNCNGGLELDSDMEKGYCIHCGSLISFSEAVKSVRLDGPIELEGYESFSTLYNFVKKALKKGTNQTSEFRERLNRALELEPDNQFLYDMIKSEIWNAKIEDNVIVQYESKVKSVVLPDGIWAIGKMAFGRCLSLEQITLPKSLRQISEGAFIYEDRLTINAYKGTYGARYAMSSPAKLSLIDIKNSKEINLQVMERILRELNIYKKTIEINIEKHFNKAYSINWALVFIILAIPIIFFFPNFGLTSLHIGASSFIIAFIFIASPVLIIKSGYDEVRCKVAIKRQIELFIKKSNDLLLPLGIKDFKYYRDVFSEPHVDLESEVIKLERARDKLLNMNMRIIYKKPDIQYSLVDYLKGEKPKDYYKHT